MGDPGGEGGGGGGRCGGQAACRVDSEARGTESRQLPTLAAPLVRGEGERPCAMLRPPSAWINTPAPTACSPLPACRKKAEKKGAKRRELPEAVTSKLGEANLLYATGQNQEAIGKLMEVSKPPPLPPTHTPAIRVLGLQLHGGRRDPIEEALLPAAAWLHVRSPASACPTASPPCPCPPTACLCDALPLRAR